MKPIRQIFLLCIFIFSFNVQAQKEFSNWYFGNKAGVKFLPTFSADLNSNMIAEEGCASISDLAGNLLFYSNGENIWNKKHQIMDNGSGIYGNASATQSVSIIPFPGKANQFMVFTMDALNGNNGLQYSIVDMSYNAGEGKVISKNTTIQTGLTEKMSITKDKSGTGFWLLVLECNAVTNSYSNTFYAYHITSAGIAKPVKSNTDFSSLNCSWVQGQMKISPDGKYIALTGNVTANDISVFTFDNETGEVIAYQNIVSNYKYYGIEFSPNSKILYATVTSQNKLQQFPIGEQMLKNVYEISTSTVLWGMQLGIDGKIYIAKSGGYLAAINSPNSFGSSLYLNEYAVSLSGRNAIQGLPSIPSNLLSDNLILYSHNCQDSGVVFDLAHTALDSVYWDFGDVGSGTNNFSKNLKSIHNYKKTGNYTVKVKIYRNGISDVLSRIIDIKTGPIFDLGDDKFLCKDGDIKLKVNINNAKYTWNTGENTQQITVNKVGTYYATSDIGGCLFKDSINVYADSLQADFVIQLKKLCLKDNEIAIQSTHKNAIKTTWYIDDKIENDTLKLKKISFTKEGFHQIIMDVESINACKMSIKKDVMIHPNPKADFSINVINACFNENKFNIEDKTLSQNGYTLNNYFLIDAVQFSSSKLDYSFKQKTGNKIVLFAINSAGCKDSLEKFITVLDNPKADFNVTFTKKCLNEQDYKITNTNIENNKSYTWKFSNPDVYLGSDSTSIKANFWGNYAVTLLAVSDNGCRDSLTKNIEIKKIPFPYFVTQKNRYNCLGGGEIVFKDDTKTDSTLELSQWNIEGNILIGLSVPYIFLPNQSYDIVHTVSISGCSATMIKQINTYEQPILKYSINQTEQCKNNNEFVLDYSETFQASSDIKEIFWKDPKNIIITQNPYRFSFNNAGKYNVKLYAISNNQCSDSTTIELLVKDIPNINMSINNTEQCKGNNMFTAVLNDVKEIAKTQWKINNELVSTAISGLNYQFNGDGTYQLNTEIEFKNNCKHTFTNQLTVFPEPILKFTANDICLGSQTEISNNSYTGNARITSWEWEIDNQKYLGLHPEITINKVGSFPVKLSTTTDKNCKTILQISNAFKVNIIPYFDFDFKIIDWNTSSTQVQFNLKSDSTLYNYNWNFGNGTNSKDENPLATFVTSDKFDVSLKASNAIGCNNTITKSFFIAPPLDIHIPNVFTPNHDRLNETFGPEGNAKCIKYHLLIVSRWGVKVFESFDWKDRWNGMYSDINAQADVYQYFLEITDEYGKDYKFTGPVNLVR